MGPEYLSSLSWEKKSKCLPAPLLVINPPAVTLEIEGPCFYHS